MLGACWAPTPSRVRQQWRTEGLGLTAAFGIAGRLDSDDLRIGGGIFERPVDRSLTVVVIVVVDGEIYGRSPCSEIGRPEEERPFGGRC